MNAKAFVVAAGLGATIASATARAAPFQPEILSTFESNQSDAHLGYSAACAGDLNGDGFSDLALGVRDYTGGHASEGRIVVHYGSATGYAAAPDWAYESNQALAFLGAAVASAGDVNGDGFHDLLAAAPSYDDGESNEGVVLLFYGGAGGLSAEPGWQRGGDQATATFGSSVAFAGDVDGDGFDDVVIGARGADGAFSNEGRVFLFRGGAGGLAAAPSWSATGGQIDPGYGWSVAGAGDVNGDGYADVIVGAFAHDAGENDEGAAFLYRGGPGGLEVAASWTGEGNQANAGYGWCVAGAGDVNGDGYADVVIGARFHDGAFSNEGKAFIYWGSAGGLAAAPGWTATGGEANAYFGWCVAAAGDVNGDGLGDVVCGAPRADSAGADAGSARLVFGRRDGALGAPAWVGSGPQAGAQFGWWVASAGDADGDGFGDFLVAAPYADSGQTDEGVVKVYRGVARSPEEAPSVRWSGGPTSDSFGRAAAFLGDVNGDGISDLAIGDPFHSNGQTSEGRVDVYYGTALGVDTTPDWTAESDQASAFFGWAVGRAGDVNGDGYDDLIVGAPNWDGAFTNEGRASLWFGSSTGLNASPAWTRLGGQPGANFGAAVAGGGDADGDGFADIAIGAPQQDGLVADVGAVQWFRGGPAGPSVLAQRLLLGNATGDEFGAAIACAGDANADGFADLIVGAPGRTAAFGSEGEAYCFRGSMSGIGPLPQWSVAGGEIEARFGGSVAYAGDVNGDGYSDVLVSGRGFDGASFDEGRAALFLGSAAGLETNASWTFASGIPGAELDALAGAGDVDGDGFSDVVVGAPSASSSVALEGAAFCFRGGAGGLENTPLWTLVGSASFAKLGGALAGAGDADGDGFADLVIGAPGLVDGEGVGGAVLLARGNGGPGASRAPRMRRAYASDPIAAGGASDAADRFRVAMLANAPTGRARVRLEIESKLLGVAFDGASLVASAWTTTSAPSPPGGSTAALEEVISGVFAGAKLHWRARIRVDSPIAPSSAWFSLPGPSRIELQLRTIVDGATGAPDAAASRPAPPAPRLSIESCAPHPVRSAASIVLRSREAGFAEVILHDVGGRRVRTVYQGPVAAGSQQVLFDAVDDSRRALAPGVYFLRAAWREAGAPAPAGPWAGAAVAAHRIVVVR